MKLNPITIEALEITDAPSLDPIRVYLQDSAPGQGRVTVECYGKAWSTYFGAISGTLREFLRAADAEYLAIRMRHPVPLSHRAEAGEAKYLLRIIHAVKEALA